MGIVAVLCSLSPKRQALLVEEPSLVKEILAARRESRIPGLLDLGKTWDALRLLLAAPEDGGEDPGDAVVGKSGKPFGVELGFGRARLLDAARVRALAKALAALPADVVSRRFARLAGATVHGNYGAHAGEEADGDFDPNDEEREELTGCFTRLVALYRKAAADGHAILVMVT